MGPAGREGAGCRPFLPSPGNFASSSSLQLRCTSRWQPHGEVRRDSRGSHCSMTRTSPQPTWATHTIPSPKNKSPRLARDTGSTANSWVPFLLPPAMCSASPLHPRPRTGGSGQPRERPLSAEPLATTRSHFPFLCSPPPASFPHSCPLPSAFWVGLARREGPQPQPWGSAQAPGLWWQV